MQNEITESMVYRSLSKDGLPDFPSLCLVSDISYCDYPFIVGFNCFHQSKWWQISS